MSPPLSLRPSSHKDNNPAQTKHKRRASSRNPLPLPKNPLPSLKNPLPSSTNPLPSPKNPLPLLKNPLPLPKSPLPPLKNALPRPKNTLPSPKKELSRKKLSKVLQPRDEVFGTVARRWKLMEEAWTQQELQTGQTPDDLVRARMDLDHPEDYRPVDRTPPWEFLETRTTESYDLMEWVENYRKFNRFMTVYASEVQTYHSRLSMDQLVRGVNPRVNKNCSFEELDNLTASLPRYPDDGVPFQVLDVNGECLLHYIPHAISGVWHQPNKWYPDSSLAGMDVKLCKAVDLLLANSRLIEEKKIAKATKAVEKAATRAVDTDRIGEAGVVEKTKGKEISIQEKKDSRYYVKDPQQQVLDQQATYLFAIWTAQGQPYSEPAVNSEFLKSTKSSNFCAGFLSSITPFVQTVSLLFERLDFEMYQKYYYIFERHLPCTALRLFATTCWACFAGIAVLVNDCVGPHKDGGDFLDGWTAMCCFGSFTRGDLCLPGMEVEGFCGQKLGGMRLPYKPDSIVFFRASLLEHYIDRFLGPRTAYVFFDKGTL